MRLGILPLGVLPEALTYGGLADALRGQDIDVIAPEQEAASAVAVAREAERIARADCDGVLVIAPEEALVPRDLPAHCALRLASVPLLLAGTFSPGYLDAAGALEEVGGVWLDRLPVFADTLAHAQSEIIAWLAENERRERQRGVEAAGKLYGERFAFVGDVVAGQNVDAARWLGQFGVVTVPIPSRRVEGRAMTGEGADDERLYRAVAALCREEAIDCVVLGGGAVAHLNPYLLRGYLPEEAPVLDGVTGGDGDGALTHRLLWHLFGQNHAWTMSIRAEFTHEHSATATGLLPDRYPEKATFARLRRVAGRYVCDVLRGRCDLDREPQLGLRAAALVVELGAGRLHFLPGEHVAALRAACHALDVGFRLHR